VSAVAGLTEYGTRLKAVFHNVPFGVRLFVSTTNLGSTGSATTAAPASTSTVPYAVLVVNESAPDSVTGAIPSVAPTTSVNGGTTQLAEIPVVNGTATAVWEVVNTNPTGTEAIDFGVWQQFTANPGANSPPPGIATVNLSYGPTPPDAFSPGAGATASSTLPLPRFADASSPVNLLAVSACAPSLSITKSHTGNFAQGQVGIYAVTVANATTSGYTSGTVTVTETVPAGLSLVSMAGTGWTCPAAGNTCTRSDTLAAGSSYPAIAVSVRVGIGANSPQVNSVSVSGGGSTAASTTDSTVIVAQPAGPVLTVVQSPAGNFIQGQTGAAYTATVSNGAGAGPTSGTVTVTDTVSSGLTLVSMGGTGWTSPAGGTACTRSDVLAAGASYPPIAITVNVAANAISPQSQAVSVSGGGSATSSTTYSTVISGPSSALRFVPITPCRIADTRKTAGAYGGPVMTGGTSRDFNIPASACGVPATAQAFSLNVAVVPSGSLGFLTFWPAGQMRPVASTLNSLDGRVKSNAAIVPAGTGGAVSVFASDTTNVILDINGYFVPITDPTGLAFYPITPCRIADTRTAAGALGGPSLAGGQSRTFPILSSACNLPATAQAYSLNFAAVPGGSPLGYVTAWPTGQTKPLASSLNASTGTITANAAIVPAGTGGAIDVFASDPTNLVIDINGYFAPMAIGGLSLYGVSPCRVLDTRKPAGSAAVTSVDVAVSAGPCGMPATAQAHVVGVTVIPPASMGYLTLWPQGQIRPLASTLNALDGAITSNLAIVPTTNGWISAYPSNAVHMVVDVFGYFAQ
jgi:uncharacterized repeat protein (TIGR01451 family)